MELIREIQQGGTTVVLVTHFMDEAEYLCDRVAVVDRGKLVALDTPEGLIDGLGLPSIVRFTTSAPDLSWLTELDVVESLAQHGQAVEIRGTGPVLALVASELVAHAGGRDSLNYSQINLTRMIEQILGLKPLNQGEAVSLLRSRRGPRRSARGSRLR